MYHNQACIRQGKQPVYRQILQAAYTQLTGTLQGPYSDKQSVKCVKAAPEVWSESH
jgi:hypothetical protein